MITKEIIKKTKEFVYPEEKKYQKKN